MGRINELRATPTHGGEPTGAGRMRRALLPPQDIQRLECLCAYIREANGGLGMVRQLYAPRMLAEVKRCAFNLRLHRHAGHRNIGFSFDYGSTKEHDEIALVWLHGTWCKTILRWIGDCAHFYSEYHRETSECCAQHASGFLLTFSNTSSGICVRSRGHSRRVA